MRRPPHGLPWEPDPARNVGVADRFAHGDLAQGLPHFSLKYGAPNIKRQFDIGSRRFHETDDACHQLLVFLVRSDQLRVRKPILQRTHQCLRLVIDQNRYDSFLLEATRIAPSEH